MLTSIDYIAIITYAVILLGIGIYSSRKQKADGYLIADRKLGVWSGLFTINATKTGSIIILYTAILYDYGLSALWYFIGVIVGYLLFIPFATVLHAHSNKKYYTLADYFEGKFGQCAKYATSVVTIIIMGGFLATNLIAAAKVLEFYSTISYTQATIFVSSIIFIYLAMAGFKAVVKTDIFQYIAMVAILILFVVPLSQGITIPASDLNLLQASTSDVIGFLLFGIFIPYASPDLWQRVYAFDTAKDMRKSIAYSLVMYIGVCGVLTLIGLLIKAQLPGIDPDIAIIRGFAQLLPMGMRGLAIVVFFAAMMSSIDTYGYTAASAIVQDFRKGLSQTQLVRAIRMMVALVMLVGTVAAILIADLLHGAFIFGGFYIVIAIPAIASALRPSISRYAINTSLVFSLLAIGYFVPLGLITNTLTPGFFLQVMSASVLGLVVGSIVKSRLPK